MQRTEWWEKIGRGESHGDTHAEDTVKGRGRERAGGETRVLRVE